MKNLVTLLLLLLLSSCNQRVLKRIYIADDDKYKITKGDFRGDSRLIEESFSDNQVKQTGKYAIDKKGKLSDLKVGEWLDYFESGQLKSRGSYEIGSYIQCCFSGPCRTFYNFKVGRWSYYYPNGQIRASGEYFTKYLHVRTSCEGGDQMPFGITNSEWEYYDESGNQIEPAIETIKELETVFGGGNSLAIRIYPDKNKENIEMDF